MLNIPKVRIEYTLLSEDQILLQNVKGFDGVRIGVTLRQATPEDLDAIALLEKELKAETITPKEMDDRTLARLIIAWGDRAIPTSLELARMPVETRGVLLDVLQQFCFPKVELVESTDQKGAT